MVVLLVSRCSAVGRQSFCSFDPLRTEITTDKVSGHRARLSPRNVLSDEASSHRRILWATSVIGGATFAALVIGLFRNKAVALIGGPEAVGLLGLFKVIISTVASIATLGLGTSAVQQLSQDLEDESQASQSRWAILSLACILASLAPH